jgi:hypothetical protein
MSAYSDAMDESPERALLAALEARLAAGEQVEVEVALALLGGHAIELDEDELRGASRRAVQLLAAEGDPRREPEPEGRAVTALAADLASPTRKAALAHGLDSLRGAAESLPEVSTRLERLVADQELAWRWFACTLLADEILGE